MFPMTKNKYYNHLDSFILEHCDREFSFKCILIKKQYFHFASSIPKYSQKVCKEFKRKGLCIKCTQNYYYDMIEGRCTKHKSFTEEVAYNQVSQFYDPVKCKSKYFLNHKTKKCVHKISHCLTITSEGRCTKCELGYATSKDQRICQRCPSNCINCADLDNCIECTPSHFLFLDRSKV